MDEKETDLSEYIADNQSKDIENQESSISEEEKKLILDERVEWYLFVPVQFEIVKAINKREIAFIDKIDKKYPIRYRWAFITDILKKHLDRIGFLGKTYNFYQSVAVLNDMPNLPYGTLSINELRKTAEYIDFHSNYEKKMFGYDLFLDFDGKENPSKAYEDTKKVKSKLDEMKVPYYLMNSSDTGFHIHVPFNYFHKFDLEVLFNVINNLKAIYKLSSLDDSVVDSKRLCKVAYSIDCKSRCVCLPLSDADFNMWNVEKVKVKNVMKNYYIKNRGLLIRDFGLNEKELIENTKKFIAKYE